MLTRDVIVIGASAGGVRALLTVVRSLTVDFPSSVLIVLHVSPTGHSILPSLLDRAGPLPAQHPDNGQKIEHGCIYVAPPDHHMLVTSQQRIKLSRGRQRENGFRPAIDPLFRSAARACGSRVIGIVLTGGLYDGTLGLARIKQSGGLAIVQDPSEAVSPSMPLSAIRNVAVDHVVPLGAMPRLLERLVREPMPARARAERGAATRPGLSPQGSPGRTARCATRL